MRFATNKLNSSMHSRSGVNSLISICDVIRNSSISYSIKKTSSRNNKAITVRRSSDNAEKTFYYDGLYVSRYSLVSFCGTGHGFVTTWYDESGNSINATQTSTSNQSLIVSSGVLVTQNNLPAINFDGSSSYLNSTLAGSTTVFSVSFWIKITAIPTGGNMSALIASDTWAGTALHFQLVSSGEVNFITTDALGVTPNYVFNINTYYHFVITYDSVANIIKYYINGSFVVQGSQGGSPTAITLSNFNIGSWNTSRYFNGVLSNVMIYKKILSSAEVTNLYKYITTGG